MIPSLLPSSAGWGFFEEDPENADLDLFETMAAEKEREQWSDYTNSLFEKSSLSRTIVEDDVEELYSYFNPAPSQCFKMSSEDITMAMEMSCCISGFRIGQRKSTGEIVAQFRFIYSYGSRSHVSWYDHRPTHISLHLPTTFISLNDISSSSCVYFYLLECYFSFILRLLLSS